MFWIFNKDRSPPRAQPMEDNHSREELSRPHAHAFLGKTNYYYWSIIIVENGCIVENSDSRKTRTLVKKFFKTLRI